MFISFVVASVLVASAEPPKEDDKKPVLSDAAKKELKKLEGKWQVVTMAHSAGDGDVTDLGVYAEVKGTGMTLSAKNKNKQEKLEVAALDPGAEPRRIDLVENVNAPGKAERALPGIYKLDGDVLVLAFATPKVGATATPPAGFGKPTEARIMVWTLKRVKE